MQQQNQISTQQQQAVAQQRRPVDVLKSMLKADSVQEQFTNALGKHRDAFIASVIDLYTSDKSLQTCKPQGIIAQALKAASMQLPINIALGFAYIVVYHNNVKVKDEHGDDKWIKVPTPTFILGYKGYIQLAMRTGQYRYINADFVYEGELRTVNRLTGEVALDGERKSDKIVGYFCYIELLNGFSKTLYMSVDNMAKYAKRYAQSLGKGTTVEALIKLANTEQSSKQVGWLGNFNDMALKTVIRRLLSKYGYLSVEMQTAFADDIAVNEQRNDLLAENANSVEFNANEVEFEEVVDKETGEVIQPNAAEQPTQSESAASESNADDDPGY